MQDKVTTYLSRYPAIKRALKFIYQSVDYGLHFHLQKKNCKFPVTRISGIDGGFFGYYDKSPESSNGKFILYHGLTKDYTDEGVSIVLHNTSDQSEKFIGRTKAYNLQSGSRLQWIDEDRFIFNQFDNENEIYYAELHHCGTGFVRKLPSAVYDVNKEAFLAIDYKQLADCNSEYGYYAHKNGSNTRQPVIYSGNLSSPDLKLLIRTDDLAQLVPVAFNDTNNLHFNHVMYNPSGTAFIFIFRWTGTQGRKEALLHYDLRNGETSIINLEMTSHYCWMDDEHVFGYMSHHSKKGYYKVSIPELSFSRVMNEELKADGHPTYKKGIFLTDTYPDHSRMQHLMILKDDNILHVGSFFSPLKYDESQRCDLHPRFNLQGDKIYFDSMHEGIRHLYCINFKKV